MISIRHAVSVRRLDIVSEAVRGLFLDLNPEHGNWVVNEWHLQAAGLGRAHVEGVLDQVPNLSYHRHRYQSGWDIWELAWGQT